MKYMQCVVRIRRLEVGGSMECNRAMERRQYLDIVVKSLLSIVYIHKLTTEMHAVCHGLLVK